MTSQTIISQTVISQTIISEIIFSEVLGLNFLNNKLEDSDCQIEHLMACLG